MSAVPSSRCAEWRQAFSVAGKAPVSARTGPLQLHSVSGISPITLRPRAAQAVQLALGCLSFDFVGTCLDESAEDLGTIQARQGRG